MNIHVVVFLLAFAPFVVFGLVQFARYVFLRLNVPVSLRR